MSKYAIEIKNLNISYKTLKPVSIKNLFFHLKRNPVEVFEAIKDVSFKIEKGKIVGIIGKNGSGKSTLLRSIAGIFSPDTGTIELHNNSVSLLSIGVGFNSALTGYENIFLSGMLLGFSEKQINEKLSEIIEFSELGSFINKPVSTYSSGMYSKLAFSITAILETDIILIDEILSVGDIHFKQKSYAKMKELISDDSRTVLIVSHSNTTIKELCDEVIWLHDGVIREVGSPSEVVSHYEEYMKNI